MTNYERIKKMSVEEMAIMLNEIVAFTERQIVDKLHESGIDCELVEFPAMSEYAQEQFLESEYEF